MAWSKLAPAADPAQSSDEAARGRLLVVVPRGLGRFDGLYRGLADLGWETTVVELDDPLVRYLSRLAGARPTLAAHRRAYLRASAQLTRTSFAFRYRSRRCGRLLASSPEPIDCVLQVGGMWAPSWPSSTIPYSLYCDCTVRLGDGNELSGVDFRAAETARRWYAHERALYHGAQAIFTASDWVRRSMVDDYGVPTDRITVVGEGINLEAPERIDRDYGARTMLFVGYEFERKGGPLLLRAFEQVRRVLPDAKLVVAGPRHRPASIPDGVTWAGPVDREQLARLYLDASLFVMTSQFEPFGLSYLEAMEWKLPCVGSDACAMREVVIDGENGRVVPPGDVEALAATLIDLLRQPARLREMGEAARRFVRSRFRWSQIAARADGPLRRSLTRADV